MAQRLAAVRTRARPRRVRGGEHDGGTGGRTGTGGPTGPTGPTGPAPSVLVAGGRAGPWTVEVRSDRTLGTGIASLAVHVTGEGGAVVADASLAVEARRPATGLVAPVTNGPWIGADGAYHLDLSIAEAAPAAAGWTFRVEVTRDGERAVATFAGIPVVDRRLAGTFTNGDTTSILAVRFEAGLRVGSNPITVTLHEVRPGAAAVPVEGAAVHVEPYMPSMGHGSTGSVDPVPTGTPGTYAGSLFFSMAGDWDTTVTVARAGSEVGRVIVAVVF